MSAQQVLLVALVLVVFVGVLQVHLDRIARAKAPELGGEFGLHLEVPQDRGPYVADDTGRRLRAVRSIRYERAYDRVDTLNLELFCETRGAKFINGRWTGPNTVTVKGNPSLIHAHTMARRIAEAAAKGMP